MTINDLQVYLSDALDQEACKKTLTGALQSRVIALQDQGISNITIITCLEHISDDTYQLNDDVIDEVVEWIIRGGAT